MWTELKARIRRHYDIAAPLYRECWGIHIHHGYWRDGTENKEVAQEQLVEVLANTVGMTRGARVLDVGCGFGGSAVYLSDRYSADVVGISISPEQLRIALHEAGKCASPPKFVMMDAEHLGFASQFEFVWAIESISHFTEREQFFNSASDLLCANGRIVIADWFKAHNLTAEEELRYIDPIVKSMLVPRLVTVEDYVHELDAAGFDTLDVRDITRAVSATWDLCIGIRQQPTVWKYALQHGEDFVSFLEGFAAMKRAFGSGAFRYGLIVAQKTPFPG